MTLAWGERKLAGATNGAVKLKTAIVGAGISGLATGQALLDREPGLELSLFEAAGRTGGKVWSDATPEGYLCEWGVNGFLDSKPGTLALCKQLGLQPVRGHVASQRRYIYRRGLLHRLPEAPPSFLTSGLLSVAGRLRVLYEILVPAAQHDDESLAEFATRRLGREAFEALIDPMASGVFAGDATRMSLNSCFPRIHELETEYGSLIRALISLQIKARRERSKGRPGPNPAGKLTSFTAGMGVLTDTLTTVLGDRVRLATAVTGISRSGSLYTLHTANGDDEEFERVILAAPAHAQAQMLADIAPGAAELLGGIQYPALSVCCFGYRREALRQPPDGFGFLVPSTERRRILGTVVDSNVFPARAPEGAVLLRTMVGGARAPELALLPDDRLIELVRAELKDILAVDPEPDFVRIYRHQQAIPQYLVGHAARLEAIDQELQRHPGLVVTGNAFRGVSLNDCIANARRLADGLSPDQS
jgi:oxygen-dependent protoporphyrinogen oxidase